MKKFLLQLLIVSVSCTMIQAQQRYLDPVFDEVDVLIDETYGGNVDVLQQSFIELKTDVYMPADDTLTDRPVILLAHTGSFIPRIINGAATGFKDDSVIVEIANRLAHSGYVVFPFTYRQGWLPTATDDNTRKGTLLQAAYRGIQDTRTLVRYVRRSVAEFGNPYGVNPEKIAVWGVGTGGYLSFGAATLDKFSEVELPKFFNTATLQPYVDTATFGNLEGTSWGTHPLSGDTLNVPNHVGYSSDIQMAINMGGALGDISWVDGDEESPIVGFHCPTDAFAPYFSGPVIVPGPNFVVLDEASGTRQAVGQANALGVNDVLQNLSSEDDPLRPYIEAFSNVDVTIGGHDIKLGTDNFYPFTGLSLGQGSPWDWWDFNVLEARVAGINATIPDANYDAQQIHDNGLLTNPDMSAEKGKRYVDTVFMVSAPRLCVGLGLDCGFSAIKSVEAVEVNFDMSPNPASDFVVLTSDKSSLMKEIVLFDNQGKPMQQHKQVNDSKFTLDVSSLSTGAYYVGVQFEKGLLVEKLMIAH